MHASRKLQATPHDAWQAGTAACAHSLHATPNRASQDLKGHRLLNTESLLGVSRILACTSGGNAPAACMHAGGVPSQLAHISLPAVGSISLRSPRTHHGISALHLIIPSRATGPAAPSARGLCDSPPAAAVCPPAMPQPQGAPSGCPPLSHAHHCPPPPPHPPNLVRVGVRVGVEVDARRAPPYHAHRISRPISPPGGLPLL